MIKCPVCQFENDEFATVCSNCKAFLQNRIPNLDLFDTAWKVIESPRKAFHEIALADHKNYSLFLFSIFGISLSFTAFWYLRLGERFQFLLELVVWAFGTGILSGLVLGILLTVFYHIVAKLVGGKASFRSSLGLLSYSLTPVVFSLFFILPVELLTFGMYLFTSNPHPFVIKPVSFVLLVAFDSAVGIWSMILAVLATMTGHQLPLVKSLVTVALTLALLLSLFFFSPKVFQT